jgi:hypothetical protein
LEDPSGDLVQFIYNNINGTYARIGLDVNGYPIYQSSGMGCWSAGQTGYQYADGDPALCGGYVDRFWVTRSAQGGIWAVTVGGQEGLIFAASSDADCPDLGGNMSVYGDPPFYHDLYPTIGSIEGSSDPTGGLSVSSDPTGGSSVSSDPTGGSSVSSDPTGGPNDPFCIPLDEVNPAIHEIVGGPYDGDCQGNCDPLSSSSSSSQQTICAVSKRVRVLPYSSSSSGEVFPPNRVRYFGTTLSDCNVYLYWLPPFEDESHSLATSYEIEKSSDYGANWVALPDRWQNYTSAPATSGTTYLFRVAAVNSAGKSEYLTSEPVSVPLITPLSPAPPDAPASIVVEPIVRGIGVRLFASVDLGGECWMGNNYLDYPMQYGEADESNQVSTWIDYQYSNSLNPKGGALAGIEELDIDKYYRVRMQACNSSGCSPYTTSNRIRPGRTPAAPTNVTALRLPSESYPGVRYSVHWEPSASGMGVRTYIVEMKERTDWVVVATTPSNESVELVEGFLKVDGITIGVALDSMLEAEGLQRLFRVRGDTGVGYGEYSEPVTFQDSSDLRPTSASYSQPSMQILNNGFSVRDLAFSWDLPSLSLTGFLVQRYEVVLWLNGLGNLGASSLYPTGENHLSIYGLSNNEYYYSVYVVYTNGVRIPASYKYNSYIVGKTYPPSNLSAISYGGNFILQWNWSEPRILKHYVVQYLTNSSSTWQTWGTTKSSSEVIVTGLQYGVGYKFRVIAVQGASLDLPPVNTDASLPFPYANFMYLQ